MQNELRAAIASEVGGLVNPKGWGSFLKSFKPIDQADPVYKDYVNLGGGHRYSLESQAESQLTQGLDRLTRGNYIGGLLRLPVGILQSKWLPASPGFVHWMFDDFIPKLKFEKFQEDTTALSNKFARPLTDAEKTRIIKTNQNFYGEMNERLFGRSGTVTSALRLIFSAPGYGEGNFRTIARSVVEKKSANFIVNSLVTSLVASTIGTRLATGQWPSTPQNPNDIRDLFKIHTNMKDGNSDPIYFDMMSYDKDYWSIYGNAATGQAAKIPSDLNARVSGMVSTPFSTLTDLSTLFKGGMVYDYKGDPVYRPTDTVPQKITKFLQFEGGAAAPISAGTFGQASAKGNSLTSSLIQAAVGIRPSTSEDVKQKKQIINDLYSLQSEKQKMQTTLDKLAGENLAEAQKQARAYNDEVKTKLRDILKGQNVSSVTTSKFFVENLRTKPPKTGTNVGSAL